MSARIVVLISGRGRNLQALIDACASGLIDGQVVAVISNHAEAGGLARARAAGIPALARSHRDFASREAFDAALIERIDPYQPNIVALAGFMRILTPAFVGHYLGRMVNIHPSLLPKYPGLHTHQRALEAGDRKHGATVHFVTAELDGGPAIIQGQFTVDAQDTADILADRVMQTIELHIYPQALAWLAAGQVRLDGARAAFANGHPAPLIWDAGQEAPPCAA